MTDIDGDHFPDLLVRKGGGEDDFVRDGAPMGLANTAPVALKTGPSGADCLHQNPPSYGWPGKVLVLVM